MTERDSLIFAIGMLEGVQAAKPELKLQEPLTILWDNVSDLSEEKKPA